MLMAPITSVLQLCALKFDVMPVTSFDIARLLLPFLRCDDSRVSAATLPIPQDYNPTWTVDYSIRQRGNGHVAIIDFHQW